MSEINNQGLYHCEVEFSFKIEIPSSSSDFDTPTTVTPTTVPGAHHALVFAE